MHRLTDRRIEARDPRRHLVEALQDGDGLGIGAGDSDKRQQHDRRSGQSQKTRHALSFGLR
jgi:hypothetical protein